MHGDVRGAVGQLPAQLEAELGLFSALPAATQDTLRRVAQGIEEDRHCAYAAAPWSLRRGTVALIRSLYGLESALQRVRKGTRLPGAKQVLLRGARRARGAARAAAVFHERLAYRTATTRRPPPPGLRNAAGTPPWADPDALLGYVDNIPVLAGAEPYAYERARNRMVASLLGFDFLRSNDRLVFLEANLNPSLRQARADLYRGDDPMWSSLLAFCREHGLARVVVYGYRPFSPSHRVSLQRQAAACAVNVRIVDDVFACGPHVRERGYFMEDCGADTLIVRAKYYRTLWDAVITNKRLTHDVMTWYNTSAPLAERVPIPRVIDASSVRSSYDPTSIFPNLVLKEPSADRGHGIHFFKGPQLPAPGAADVLVQEFVPPDTADVRIARDEEELMTTRGARHVRIFRTHALLTPLGPVHLSGHSVTSVDTLPSAPLADGFVDAAARFMANFSAGGRYGQLRPHEERWCREAGLSAAQAFQHWVSVKYQVE